MKDARRLVAMGLLLGFCAEAWAQLRVLPPPPPFAPGAAVGGFAPVGGFGVGFTYSRRNLAISGFAGRSYFGPGYGFGFGTSSVTYIISPPAQIVIAPPIIINNNINVNPPAGGPDDGSGPGPRPIRRRPLHEDHAAEEEAGRRSGRGAART